MMAARQRPPRWQLPHEVILCRLQPPAPPPVGDDVDHDHDLCLDSCLVPLQLIFSFDLPLPNAFFSSAWASLESSPPWVPTRVHASEVRLLPQVSSYLEGGDLAPAAVSLVVEVPVVLSGPQRCLLETCRLLLSGEVKEVLGAQPSQCSSTRLGAASSAEVLDHLVLGHLVGARGPLQRHLRRCLDWTCRWCSWWSSPCDVVHPFQT